MTHSDPTLTTTAPHSLIPAQGSWETAKRWLDGAKRFEQGKLMCQVMLGFELMALRKASGVQRGGDRKSDDSKEAWEATLKAELGIPWSTAYRFMDMAKAASARLKKLPELRTLDLLGCAIRDLTPAQCEALETGVHKLTDGKTQLEFAWEMGLAKRPGNPNLGGRVERSGAGDTMTMMQMAEAERKAAYNDWLAIDRGLELYGARWAILDDSVVLGQVAIMEIMVEERKRWLNTPRAERDPKVAEDRVRARLGKLAAEGVGMGEFKTKVS